MNPPNLSASFFGKYSIFSKIFISESIFSLLLALFIKSATTAPVVAILTFVCLLQRFINTKGGIQNACRQYRCNDGVLYHHFLLEFKNPSLTYGIVAIGRVLTHNVADVHLLETLGTLLLLQLFLFLDILLGTGKGEGLVLKFCDSPTYECYHD